jgi:hypothetical protein
MRAERLGHPHDHQQPRGEGEQGDGADRRGHAEEVGQGAGQKCPHRIPAVAPEAIGAHEGRGDSTRPCRRVDTDGALLSPVGRAGPNQRCLAREREVPVTSDREALNHGIARLTMGDYAQGWESFRNRFAGAPELRAGVAI